LAEPVITPPAATPIPDVGLASAATQMALALLLVLAIILVGFWILRRFGPKFGLGPGGRGGMLRIMAQLGLGARKHLVVVRFLNKDLLLGVTDHTITLLTEVPISHEADSDFAETLAREAGQPSTEPPG
jgi:flagellar protein FliO/FliZ